MMMVAVTYALLVGQSALTLPAQAQAPTPISGIHPPGGNTYYVSSSTGDDIATGLEPRSAWKSLEKLNATTFEPGDRILLESGDTWNGTTLHPLGSGTLGRPIILGSYGSTTAKPIINAEDASLTMDTFNLIKGTAAGLAPYTEVFYTSVYLYNQQYWVIKGLDVSNHSAGFINLLGDSKPRTGILIMNDNAGTLHGIDVRDNDVHDVLGSKSDKTYWGGAGIMYTVMLKSPTATTGSNYDDIQISGNDVTNTNRQGITTNSRQNLREDIDYLGDLPTAVEQKLSPWYPSTDVMISDNYVGNVAGDGILPQVTQHAVVEHNTVNGFNERSRGASAGIWAWNADNTVFQFNEASGGHTTQDGEAYDVDYGQTGTIYQYNYSHDNDGGFMLFCSPGQGSDPSSPANGIKATNAVVRYNVSQDDSDHIFQFSGYSTGSLIYNNTAYQAPGINARPVDFWAWNKTYPTSASFYNNIFDLQSAGIWNYTDQGLTMQGLVFDSNTIFGVHSAGEPADEHKQTTDPLLAAPGTGSVSGTGAAGTDGAPSLDGYRPAPASPAIGSGKVIETPTGRTFDDKTTNGGRDYAGDLVLQGFAPDRGAFEAGLLRRWPIGLS